MWRGSWRARLAEVAIQRQARRTGLLVGEINGQPRARALPGALPQDAGFVDTAYGFQMRRVAAGGGAGAGAEDDDEKSEPETA